MNTITERVERGAALLDRRRPGWWRDINLATLEIRSHCNCIVGQLHKGRYLLGLAAFGLYEDEAPDYGFDMWRTSFAPVDAHFTDAWSELIQQRRKQARAAA